MTVMLDYIVTLTSELTNEQSNKKIFGNNFYIAGK